MSEQEITEEFTDSVDLGNNNLVHESTFNAGVRLEQYNRLDHCYINGTAELGDNCIVTGCVIHNAGDAGIYITGSNNIIGGFDPGRNITTKFTEEAIQKSWNLLEEYMTPSQYFAFMEGDKIELWNDTEKFRLLIGKNGDFFVLEGKGGEGIVASSGRVRSYNYPLGDEIAAFLDWFKFKTKELISQWNCGTYGIVKEGQRR